MTVTSVKGRMDEEALARLAAAPWAQLSRLSEARGLGGHGASGVGQAQCEVSRGDSSGRASG